MLCLATCVVIAARWRAASPPRRRALLPSVAGGACLLLFVWLLVTDLVEGPRSQVMIMVAYSSMLVVPAAFLAGLLRSRLARGGLAQLFRELGGMRGEALQAALGRTLGDPTLVLAYRLPDSRGPRRRGRPAGAGAAGHAGEPARRSSTRGARWRRSSTTRRSTTIRSWSRRSARRRRSRSTTSTCLAESEARLAEVQASRQRIVAAGDAERRRLERDLHDGAQQRLVALALQLRMIQAPTSAATPRRRSSW